MKTIVSTSSYGLNYSATPGSKTASATSSTSSRQPEDFLTVSDIDLLKHVTGTDSLEAAEQNPHAKALAVSIGTKRENGWVTGDYSQYYMPAQLNDSDAKMVESLTGTTNIIDALNAGNQGVNDLVGVIGLDRGHKQVSGDLTADYMQRMIDFDNVQATQHAVLELRCLLIR